jgi:hypothetical protein
MPSAESSRQNLQKAFASPRYHKPLPLRSLTESRVIRALVAHWFIHQEKCSGRELARRLGVSQMWVWKLKKKFAGFSEKELPRELLHGCPTFEGLKRAQEKTQKLRERGWIRCPSSKSEIPTMGRVPSVSSDSDVLRFI